MEKYFFQQNQNFIKFVFNLYNPQHQQTKKNRMFNTTTQAYICEIKTRLKNISPVNKLLFHPPNTTNNIKQDTSTYKKTNGNTYYVQIGDNPFKTKQILIFCHGNACDALDMIDIFGIMSKELDVTIFGLEYPGYGPTYNKNTPTEDNIYKACDDFLLFLIKTYASIPISVLGHSIGGGPACYIACNYRIQHLILLSTFASIHAVAQDYIGKWITWVSFERFNNDVMLKNIKCPTLIVHGTKDTIVYPRHAQVLFQSVCGTKFDKGYNQFIDQSYEKHHLIFLSDAGHNLDSNEWYKVCDLIKNSFLKLYI